jgi:hypothetical protein
VVSQAMARFDTVVLAYCLMDQSLPLGHPHPIVAISHPRTVAAAQRHPRRPTTAVIARSATVQGRFKGILVDENAYLLEVCAMST